MGEVPKAVVWSGSAVRLLDQTRLPHEETYLECLDAASVRQAICNLSVRGAPAIGIAAAYGLIVGGFDATTSVKLLEALQARADDLKSARPTAVNLAWALDRMMTAATAIQQQEPAAILAALEAEAVRIHKEDAAACRAIGEFGEPLIAAHPNLLTHCNAGALAVSELGTALAPVYHAHRSGVPLHVYVDETRPLLQGARLTAFELMRAGVPATLITDNMAAHVMSLGKVDAVIVGADRVAANGDVANKIGTLNLAILCAHYGLPFYVACPHSTIDLATPSGDEIEIEERNPVEVAGFANQQVAPSGMTVFNPAFDVTPAALVTAIVTDRGIITAPFQPGLHTLFS